MYVCCHSLGQGLVALAHLRMDSCCTVDRKLDMIDVACLADGFMQWIRRRVKPSACVFMVCAVRYLTTVLCLCDSVLHTVLHPHHQHGRSTYTNHALIDRSGS